MVWQIESDDTCITTHEYFLIYNYLNKWISRKMISKTVQIIRGTQKGERENVHATVSEAEEINVCMGKEE